MDPEKWGGVWWESQSAGGISGRKELCGGPEASENNYPYLRYTQIFNITGSVTNQPKSHSSSQQERYLFPGFCGAGMQALFDGRL